MDAVSPTFSTRGGVALALSAAAALQAAFVAVRRDPPLNYDPAEFGCAWATPQMAEAGARSEL